MSSRRKSKTKTVFMVDSELNALLGLCRNYREEQIMGIQRSLGIRNTSVYTNDEYICFKIKAFILGLSSSFEK